MNDLECLQYANMLCNEEGIDPISFGTTVGAVMELYGMGVISKEQLGIEASFGSARALAFLAEETVNGRGFGKEIGLGSKRLCAKYGHPELSMASKGQEFPRPTMVAPSRASAWPTPPATAAVATCAATPLPRKSWASRSRPIRWNGASPSWSKPSRTPRRRLTPGSVHLHHLCLGLAGSGTAMQGACDEAYTVEELALIGERIWNMEREFNNRAGFTSKDDSQPPRLTTPEGACKTGPAKGKFNELATMLPVLRGSRRGTPKAAPTAATKARLGL